MYFDTRIEYDDQVIDEFIEKEMYRVGKEALEKLSPIFAHPKYLNGFAMTLGYAWFDSQEYAERLANHLDLDKLDFLAIQGCYDTSTSKQIFDAFKEQYLKDYEYAQNF
jgi:hypothetical protein